MALRQFARNKAAVAGALVVVALLVAAAAAPWLAPYPPNQQDYAAITQPPSRQHWFGTDELGRDVLSRVLYGARVSLLSGSLSVAIALAISLPVGLLSGYYRGFWDEVVVMRVVDALQAFPFLILALAMAAALGPGLRNAMVAIGISFVPSFIRVIRAQVLQVREMEFVQAARSLGATDLRILLRHILPNCLGPILVQASLGVATAIIAEAGLSYLGLGVQPPDPSWGSALRFAQGYLQQAPWMSYFPGAAIFLAVLAFNLLGDGLRDALDPRLGRE